MSLRMIESSCSNLNGKTKVAMAVYIVVLYFMYRISDRNWIIDRFGIVRILWGRSTRYWTRNILVEITRAVTRIFRAGRVFHANYSCYLCPACAERVRGLFAKTFQRDSSVSSSRSLSSNFPGSFVPPLLAPPLCPRLFLLLFFLCFFFSFFFSSSDTSLHSWDTLHREQYFMRSYRSCFDSQRYFFFIFNSTLKKLHWISIFFFLRQSEDNLTERVSREYGSF